VDDTKRNNVNDKKQSKKATTRRIVEFQGCISNILTLLSLVKAIQLRFVIVQRQRRNFNFSLGHRPRTR
jgi:hypothetical protein